MKRNDSGFSIYLVVSIVFFLVLVFVLALPQKFDLNAKENTDTCIKNMKSIKHAMTEYIKEYPQDKNPTLDDLVKLKKIKQSENECPTGNVGDKYIITIDPKTQEVTVKCPNEAEFKDHVLPVTEE